MMRTLDFWLGSGVFSAWYVVFYLGVAAGIVPYMPQIAERFAQPTSGPESLGVFCVALLCWGGPLILFSIIHTLAFLACGGDPFWVRLLWGIGLLAVAAVSVVVAALLAAGSPRVGLLACHALLAALFVANLRVLWIARHAAPVRMMLS